MTIKTISRQRAWQHKRKQQGLCVQCGKVATAITTKLGMIKAISYCKKCCKKNNHRSTLYYKVNRNQIRDKARKHYLVNHDKIRAYYRKYYYTVINPRKDDNCHG